MARVKIIVKVPRKAAMETEPEEGVARCKYRECRELLVGKRSGGRKYCGPGCEAAERALLAAERYRKNKPEEAPAEIDEEGDGGPQKRKRVWNRPAILKISEERIQANIERIVKRDRERQANGIYPASWDDGSRKLGGGLTAKKF